MCFYGFVWFKIHNNLNAIKTFSKKYCEVVAICLTTAAFLAHNTIFFAFAFVNRNGVAVSLQYQNKGENLLPLRENPVTLKGNIKMVERSWRYRVEYSWNYITFALEWLYS